MRKIIVAGIGTGVGKTVVAAILTTLYQAFYWKPIDCGDTSDNDTSSMRKLLKPLQIYPSAYSFKQPLSPHHAARLENICIKSFAPPDTKSSLIIEAVGGVLVPYATNRLTIDLFQNWDCQWILVSRHYLGSINHTLLTLEALKQRKISLAGLIFNGESHPDTEQAICEISGVPFLARLLPEPDINKKIIQKYAKLWSSLL